MMCTKCFGILIEVEGVGMPLGDIAGIARDRETKTLPRIDADERGSGMGLES